MRICVSILLATVMIRPLCAQEPHDSVAGQYRIEQVTVEGRKFPSPLGGISDGTLRFNMQQSDALPRFAGVIDPMRIVQLMPGVQTSADGDSGFYVRGGDAGHSSVLLNNAPLYSYAHLFGFFSSFNPGHVRSFELDKSGMGAASGDSPGAALRARSVDEIPPKWGLSGDVGIISAQATLALPLGRKAALYLSGRRSYAEWLIALISTGDDTQLKYRMQDYDATFVWEPSPRHKLIVNGHFGDDRVRTRFDQYLIGGKIRWHNSASSVQLQSELSERLSLENTVYLSDFASRLDMATTGTSIATPSSIVDAGYKGALTWHGERFRLRAGINYAYRAIRPQYIVTDYNLATTGEVVPKPRYRTHEAAPYLSMRSTVGRRFDIELSVRWAVYTARRIGRDGRYTASSPEPGVGLEYRLTPEHRLKAAYAYGVQYTGLVPVSNISFSTDFWMAATRDVPPMRSHNVSAGYYASLLDGSIRFSVEGYYRRMYHALEFDMPLMSMLHQVVDIERHIYSGDGASYGAEMIVAYASRRLNGWVSYSLGRSVRRFPQLNDGRPFPAKQDRRHNLSVALTWSPTPRWDAGAVFVYASGAAYTSPTEFYLAGGTFVRGHGSYNGSRLPDYQRLDLSLTRWFGRTEEHRHGLNLSVYNCFARKNPFYVSWPIYYREEEQKLKTSRRKHHLYTILPSVSWIFRF